MSMPVVNVHVYVHARQDVSIYPMSVSMPISVSMPKSVSFSLSVSMSVSVSEFVFVSMSLYILLYIFRVNVHVHVSISVSPSLFPHISISALSLRLSAAIFSFLAPCVSSSLSIYLCLFPSVSSPQSLFFCISAISLPLRLSSASLHPSLPSICPLFLSLVSQPLSYPLYLCSQSLSPLSLYCLSPSVSLFPLSLSLFPLLLLSVSTPSYSTTYCTKD
jgi:hypothetical protein